MAKRKKSSRQFIEQLVKLGKPEAVDRAAGVIRGVKILGLESQNGRRYAPAALAAAAAMYEGRPVNTDHPVRSGSQRSVHDRFGWFTGIVARADGLYGDFHILNPKTELAESVFLAAENKPDLYGFSHVAQGEGDVDQDGIFVVGKILTVESVDLVAEPATTSGLFEGRKPTVKKKLKLILESVLPRLPVKQRPTLKALIEMPEMDAALGQEMDDAPDEAADPRQALADVVSMLAASTDAANHDLAAKIMKLLKPEAAVAEDDNAADGDGKKPDEPAAEGKGGKGKGKGEGDDPEKKMESIQRDLEALRRKDTVRELCEAEGVQPSKALLKALCGLDDEADRKALLQESKKSQTQTQQPRSRTPGSAPANGTSATLDQRLSKVSDAKSFVEAIRRK